LSVHLSNAQKWLWGSEAKVTTGYAEGYSGAIDNRRNAYIVGWYSNSIKYGTQNLTTPAEEAMDIVKYDPYGNVIWTVQDSGYTLSDCEGQGVTTDKNGNVYATGGFSDSIKFGAITLNAYNDPNGMYDAFLVKYDSNGKVLWARQSTVSPSNSTCYATAITVDDSGYVYIIGYSPCKTLKFGTDSLVNSSYFIVKYDSIGNVKWLKGAQGSIGGHSIATDALNNLYVTGSFEGTCIFDTFPIYQTTGSYSTFLTKYNAQGKVEWVKDSWGENAGCSVAVSGNDIYITGSFSDASSFGSQNLPAPPYSDFFLVKYDSGGSVLWLKEATNLDVHNWTGYSVTIDMSGNIYCSIGGWNSSLVPNYEIAFGSDTLKTINNSDGDDGSSVMIMFDSLGNEICGSMVPGGGDDESAILADPTGQYVYLIGDLWGDTVYCGPDTLHYQYDEATFIARWQPCNSDAGINQIASLSTDVKVYPNPSTGLFRMEEQGLNAGKHTIEVYNVLGEQVYSKGTNELSTVVNLEGQPTGIYFYRIVTDNISIVASGKVILK